MSSKSAQKTNKQSNKHKCSTRNRPANKDIWVREHPASPSWQNWRKCSQSIPFYHITGYLFLFLCVLQFRALPQIANAHLDIGQERRLEKEKKCQWQTYFTFFCLPNLLNEVSVIDPLIIYHLWGYSISLNCSSSMPPIKPHHDAVWTSNTCYIAGVTQSDTAKPICFSH